MQDTYYLSDRNANNKLIVLCKDNAWRLYEECKQDWNQVLQLSNANAYILREAWRTSDQKYGSIKCNISIRNNRLNRSTYALLQYKEETNTWQLLGKCIADNWRDACKKFSVDIVKAAYLREQRVSHCGDLWNYDKNNNIAIEFNKFGVMH